jgi:hypothetical protein
MVARLKVYRPSVCCAADLTEMPREVSVKVARRILFEKDWLYYALGIATNESCGYTVFDVRRHTMLRLIRQVAKRSKTVLLSELFGTLVVG